MKRVNGKSGQGKIRFAGVPHRVMQSDSYKAVSGNAVQLLLELSRQYNSGNNGDLTCAHSVLKEQGFKSRQTIDRAKKELIKNDLIRESRAGQFRNPHSVCALYALTWQSVDDCNGKLDIKSTIRPLRQF